MATITITKSASGGNIGKEDLTLQSGTTTTFSRATSAGGSNTLTRLARSTLNTREYDVIQYGAVGNGMTDDTAAIQAAITECATSGGTVVFPPGYTYRVSPTAANVPIFTLSVTKPITFWMYGATIIVKGTASEVPSTAANEKTKASVFFSQGDTSLSFLGGTVDLNRDYADGDPQLGFFKGFYSNNTTFKDINFVDGTNLGGVIFMSDAVASQLVRWHSLTVENCTFTACTLGVRLEGAMRNVHIVNNKFQYMDLAIRQNATSLYGVDDGYGASTYRPARCVKVEAFTNGAPTATDTINGGVLGNTFGINISGNTVYGGSLAVEVTAATITDSQYLDNVTIQNNTIWALAGVTLNMASNSAVSNNTFKRLNSGDLTAYDLSAYVNGITTGSFLTDVLIGTGIDARTCQDVVVSDNVVDGGYAFSSQENEFVGITVGESTLLRTVNATVSGNTVRKCQYGIVPEQCSNTLINGNRVNRCKYALSTNFDRDPADSLRNTSSSWKDNALENNWFIADSSEHSGAGNSLVLVELESDWVVKGNTFIGRTATGVDMRLLVLRGFDGDADGVAELGDYSLKDNVFRRFQYSPLEVVGGTTALLPWAVARISLTGNEFYSEQSSLPAVTVGCVQLGRATNGGTLVVNGGHNFANKVRRAFIMTYPGADGGSGTYNFGQWEHDQNSDTTSTWRLFDDGGVTNSGATGYGDVFRSGRGIQVKQMQLNCNSGTATTVVTDGLPYGLIWAVNCRNDSTIVMGSSGAEYQIGYGVGGTATLADKWGAVTALTNDAVSNTLTTSPTQTPLMVGISSTQKDIILTATLAGGGAGGTFTSGQVVVSVYYTPASGDDF